MIAAANPEVVVIGGGPAGATTATLLAQQGRSVRLLERERFPRYHVGESLIPETFWVLDRLGILPHLRGGPFVEKHSVQFVSEQGRVSEPFYFADYNHLGIRRGDHAQLRISVSSFDVIVARRPAPAMPAHHRRSQPRWMAANPGTDSCPPAPSVIEVEQPLERVEQAMRRARAALAAQ